jgi:hypothetical protein
MTIHKTTIRCGDTLHVLVAATQAELASLSSSKAKSLLRANGDAVTLADGRSTWIVDEEIHPSQWHSDGNRVRANRVLCEKSPDGEIARTVERRVWIRAVP